jgi:hypothetical protein
VDVAPKVRIVAGRVFFFFFSFPFRHPFLVLASRALRPYARLIIDTYGHYGRLTGELPCDYGEQQELAVGRMSEGYPSSHTE